MFLMDCYPCKVQILVRSLFCLGLLVRYGYGLMDACNNQHPYIVKCLSLLKKYLLLEDFGIKVRALQVFILSLYMLCSFPFPNLCFTTLESNIRQFFLLVLHSAGTGLSTDCQTRIHVGQGYWQDN